MFYDLEKVRNQYHLTPKQMGALMGIREVFYKKYESRNELPSKYVYMLWEKLENFPIPEDFFYFTSFTLLANMKYHNMTQKEVAEALGFANQTTISNFIQDNIPMYEKKQEFIRAFSPLIVPYAIENYETNTIPEKMTDLVPRGNLMLAETRKKRKEEREKLNHANDCRMVTAQA